jgi:acyl carrier protein
MQALNSGASLRVRQAKIELRTLPTTSILQLRGCGLLAAAQARAAASRRTRGRSSVTARAAQAVRFFASFSEEQGNQSLALTQLPSPGAKQSEDTLSKVRNIISQQLNAELDKVSPEAKFVDLGADSLDTVEIMMSLEEQFDITLDEEGAENIATVQEAADMIEQFVAQARATAPLPPATLVIHFHVFIHLLVFVPGYSHAENVRGACNTERD